MKVLTLFIILSVGLFTGCDPRDDASMRGGRVGGNRYFEATREYPEYYIVEHQISGYRPEKEVAYFQKSLELAQPVLTNLGANPRTERVQYVVFVLLDVDPSKHAATFDERLPSARLFRRADIIASRADLQQLVEKTPSEPPPFSSPATSGSMTLGGPIIIRHAKVVAERRAAMQQPAPEPGSGPGTN